MPRPVRAPILAWLAAVAAGVAESLVRLAMPDPPGPADLAVRGAIYLAVVVAVLSLRTGSNVVRWVLALGLGIGGTASLLVEPITWLIGGGSPTAFVATVDVATAAVVVLRVAHLGAVAVAVVLMFRAGTSELIRSERSRRASCHFQAIAQRGTCRKTSFVSQNHRAHGSADRRFSRRRG